jgi:hypothetical protein
MVGNFMITCNTLRRNFQNGAGKGRVAAWADPPYHKFRFAKLTVVVT